MGASEGEQLWQVDDGDELRAAAADVKARFVHGDGDAEGARGVEFKLVERHIDGAAVHIRTEEGDGVSECAAVLKMRERNEIFGIEAGDDAKLSIGGDRGVEAVRQARHGDAVGDACVHGIDDGDLCLRLRAMRRGIGIDVGDVEQTAIGRGLDVACTASGGQPFFFRAGRCVEHGYVVGDAVGDEQMCAVGREREARRLRASGPRCGYCVGLRVDDGDGVVPRVGDEETRAVGGEHDAARLVAHGDGVDGFVGLGVEHAHLVAAVAQHVESRAALRRQYLQRRGVGEHCAVEIGPCRLRARAMQQAGDGDSSAQRACGEQCRGGQPALEQCAHFGSSTVSTRSTACFSSVCSRPLGQ